jgi:hypothetical protein
MDIKAYQLHTNEDAHGILHEGLNLVLAMDVVIKLLRVGQDERSVADSIEVIATLQGSKAARFVCFPKSIEFESIRSSL